MKNQHFFSIMAIVAVCLCQFNDVTAQENKVNPVDSAQIQYDGYELEFSADTMQIQDVASVNLQQPALVFEKDTFDFGIIHRSANVAFVAHIMCKCNSEKDVRIKEASITNMYGRVSTSPIIPRGAKGTILCIIDKKSIKLGKHVDTVTIYTDSESTPEISIYVAYEVAPEVKSRNGK